VEQRFSPSGDDGKVIVDIPYCIAKHGGHKYGDWEVMEQNGELFRVRWCTRCREVDTTCEITTRLTWWRVTNFLIFILGVFIYCLVGVFCLIVWALSFILIPVAWLCYFIKLRRFRKER
jgi:hypothetical protein